MGKKKQQQPGEYKLSREIAGIVLFAFCIFFVLCLISYHPQDPSFTHFTTDKIAVNNWGGIIGAYLSDSFLQVFGLSAYWFIVLLLCLAYNLFTNRPIKTDLLPLIGVIGIILATSGLLATSVPAFHILGSPLSAGGLLGRFSSDFLQAYISLIGTYIFFFVILITATMVTLNVSAIFLSQKFIEWTGTILDHLKNIFKVIQDKWKQRQTVTAPLIIRKKPSLPQIPLITSDMTASSYIEKKPKKAVAKDDVKYELEIQPPQNTGEFMLPPLILLEGIEQQNTRISKENLIENSSLLEKTLSDFGVQAKVVEVKPGPVITMYELEPAPGVKINKITNLADDLALALKAQSIRIIAPIPGKSVIGIEIPNPEREAVSLKEVLTNGELFEPIHKLPIVLGKDIVGVPVITDLARMPHLLIAGTTGSGKSVALNAMICCILLKSFPDDVKFIMIDPKRLELSGYEGIPHLLHPVVVDPQEASHALKWTVAEMERRYKLIAEAGLKSIEAYNKSIAVPNLNPRQDKEESSTQAMEDIPDQPAKIPYIIVVIDELADLMMVAQRNVEESLTRLAQMARAAGIHLILATQRPSVDVITGIIKANFPTRISFQVSSKVDSRTILDQLGAEKLLGAGDMLFIPPGISKLIRIHGAYVSDREIDRIVAFLKKQRSPEYNELIGRYMPETQDGKGPEEEFDEKYDAAVALVTDLGQASISLVQRYLKIGYNRAARIIETMEREGVVGPSDGAKPRKVLVGKLPQ